MGENEENKEPKRITIGKEGDFPSVDLALWENPGEKSYQFVLLDKVHPGAIQLGDIDEVSISSVSFTWIDQGDAECAISFSGRLLNINNIHIRNCELGINVDGTRYYGNYQTIRAKVNVSNSLFDNIKVGVDISNAYLFINNSIFYDCVIGIYSYYEAKGHVDLDLTECLFYDLKDAIMRFSVKTIGEKSRPCYIYINSIIRSCFFQEYQDMMNYEIMRPIENHEYFNFGDSRLNVTDSLIKLYRIPERCFLERRVRFYDPRSYDFRHKDEGLSKVGPSIEFLNQIRQYMAESIHQTTHSFTAYTVAKPGIYVQAKLPQLISNINRALDSLRTLFECSFAILAKKEDTGYDKLFIIMTLDEKEPTDAPFAFIEHCRKVGKPFYILMTSRKFPVSEETMNLERLPYIRKVRDKLSQDYSDHVLTFDSLDELAPMIYERCRSHTSSITLTRLTLKNIGAFTEFELSFEKQLNCLIGLNGTGKTTILRALALAITGSHKSLNLEALGRSLLRIQGLEDGRALRGKGCISLDFLIDGQKHTNRVELVLQSDNSITVTMEGNSPILNGDYLKSLVLGFAQVRGKADPATQQPRGSVQPPYIPDLSPMIHDAPDNRLSVFESWISGLDATANRKEKEQNSSEKAVSERRLLEECFAIFSQITDQQVRFRSVEQPGHRVWVETVDAPQGIPIAQTSQGFQAVMGWVGYLLQRLFEAYHLAEDPKGEPVIVMVDEIDSYLHPQWQVRILDVLCDSFPNAQFIISTHSPLVVHGLERGQVNVLERENNKIVGRPNASDLWAWTYQDILDNLYKTHVKPSKYQEHELEARLAALDAEKQLTDDQEQERRSLQDNLNRLRESLRLRDEVTRLQVDYKQKMADLDQMIKKVKGKV